MGVRQSIPIGVTIRTVCSGGVIRIKTIGPLPAVGKSVAVGVGIQRIGRSQRFRGIHFILVAYAVAIVIRRIHGFVRAGDLIGVFEAEEALVWESAIRLLEFVAD